MTELKRRSEADALRYVLQKIAEFPYIGEKAAQQMQLMAKGVLDIDADAHAQCAPSSDDLREAMMCLFIKMNDDRPPIDTQIGALMELFDAAISDYRSQTAVTSTDRT